MEYLKAVILGIVQGATEFLPVSSSGHLSVFQHFMGLSGDGSLQLTVFLHIGTLVAVIAVYYKTLWRLVKELGRTVGDVFTRKLDRKHISDDRHMLYMMVISCIPLLFLFIPVGGGRNLKDLVEGLANDSDILVEGFCFLFTAILLLTGARAARVRKNIRPVVEGKDAWWVGMAQLAAAAFPGISRSGSTISTGMLLGVNKDYMVEYSFVLGTPAILAAAVLEIKDALEGGAMALSLGPVLVGIVVAALVGVAAIKLLEWLVHKDKFQFFGYYCLILSAVVITLATLEKLGIL
ncbi:MAG: undecaprenyl-diphosphate phosphatase [Clostridia bacterium]|nr:undecaprenyl-diphosphate phosphatase [Clostridia bacterium]